MREPLNCFNKCLFNCGVSGRSIEKLLRSIEKLLLARDVINVFICGVSRRNNREVASVNREDALRGVCRKYFYLRGLSSDNREVAYLT